MRLEAPRLFLDGNLTRKWHIDLCCIEDASWNADDMQPYVIHARMHEERQKDTPAYTSTRSVCGIHPQADQLKWFEKYNSLMITHINRMLNSRRMFKPLAGVWLWCNQAISIANRLETWRKRWRFSSLHFQFLSWLLWFLSNMLFLLKWNSVWRDQWPLVFSFPAFFWCFYSESVSTIACGDVVVQYSSFPAALAW